MKKLLLTMIACLVMSSMVHAADKKSIPAGELPAKAQTFIKANCNKASIDRVTMETDDGFAEYEVILQDGSKIKFDHKGTWEQVECRSVSVPESIVPAGISKYVKANNADQKIVEIEREDRGYQIELSPSHRELRFDRNAKFLGYDN